MKKDASSCNNFDSNVNNDNKMACIGSIEATSVGFQTMKKPGLKKDLVVEKLPIPPCTMGDSFIEDEFSVSDFGGTHPSTDTMQTTEKLLPSRPHQALEYPPLYFLLKRFPKCMETIKQLYMYRWRASYPLQKKLPCSRALRKIGVHLTWGESLLLLPFLMALVAAMVYTFSSPSVTNTGHVARTALIGCFVFAQRNSLVTLLLGMPIDRTLFYHKLSGRIALISTIGHAWAFYIEPRFQAGNEAIRARVASSLEGSVNTSGTIMTWLICTIIVTSLPLIRRRVFELFYYMHIVCASGLVMGAFFHTGLLVPLLVAATWGVDLFFRSIVMARHRYPTKAKIRILSATVVELSFPKVEGFDYNPGQYIFLSLPELSYLEWHPFSISSAPKMKNVTLHIRRAGNWTSALYKLAKKRTEVDILLEGPYGNLGVDLFGDRYKMVMLVSGGIGITPMQSICDQLLFEEAKKKRKMKKIKFIWTDRDPVMMVKAPVVRRMSSVDFPVSSASDAGSVNADSEESTEEKNSALIFSQLVSLLPPGMATDEDLDNFYESLSLLMDHDAEFLSDSNGTLEDSGDDLDVMAADDTSVADNHDPWDRDPECNKTLGEILEMQLFHTGDESELHIPYARQGRPDIKKIFLDMKEEAKGQGEKRVAVCVCAPRKLSAICRKACIVYSDKNVCFDFHTESMEQ